MSEGPGPEAAQEEAVFSDVDWSGGEEVGEEIVPPAQPLPTPPELVPPGYLAFCPEPLNDNRLARELGATVVTFDWGSRKGKPERRRGKTQGTCLQILACK